MDVCKVEGGNAGAGKLGKRMKRGLGAEICPQPTLLRKLLQGFLWGQVESCLPSFSHFCIVNVPMSASRRTCTQPSS